MFEVRECSRLKRNCTKCTSVRDPRVQQVHALLQQVHECVSFISAAGSCIIAPSARVCEFFKCSRCIIAQVHECVSFIGAAGSCIIAPSARVF